MIQAARLLVQFSEDRTFEEYTENPMLRSAIERQFVWGVLKRDVPGLRTQVEKLMDQSGN